MEFYRAYVEDDADPKKLQRLRVRILGVHSQEIDELPINCLPWAEPCIPITVGDVGGDKGYMDTPSIGNWVWIFFEDALKQLPHYFAIIRTEKDKNSTFKQPNSITESLANDKVIRNKVIKDRWDNVTIVDNDHYEKTDTWQNKVELNRDTVQLTNGSAKVNIKLESDGNITIFSDAGGTVKVGNSALSSAVNFNFLSKWMESIEKAIETHVHNGNLGYPTGPGIAPTISSISAILRPQTESPKLQIPDNMDQ